MRSNATKKKIKFQMARRLRKQHWQQSTTNSSSQQHVSPPLASNLNPFQPRKPYFGQVYLPPNLPSTMSNFQPPEQHLRTMLFRAVAPYNSCDPENFGAWYQVLLHVWKIYRSSSRENAGLWCKTLRISRVKTSLRSEPFCVLYRMTLSCIMVWLHNFPFYSCTGRTVYKKRSCLIISDMFLLRG